MATIDQWAGQNLGEIGPVYPFIGTEILWFIVCVAIWLLWHVWQLRNERRTYEEDLKKLKDPEVLRWAVHNDTMNGDQSKAQATEPGAASSAPAGTSGPGTTTTT